MRQTEARMILDDFRMLANIILIIVDAHTNEVKLVTITKICHTRSLVIAFH